MHDSNQLFLVGYPALLTLLLLLLGKESRRAQALCVAGTGLVAVLAGLDLGQAPSVHWSERLGESIIYCAPFAGVLASLVLFTRNLREHPILLLVAVPVSYYLGFLGGLNLAMLLGLVRP
jgi:hypothetical protein